MTPRQVHLKTRKTVRQSTRGFGGGPKIVMPTTPERLKAYPSGWEELYGHGCRTAKEAEEYVALIGSGTFKVVYDDEPDPTLLKGVSK